MENEYENLIYHCFETAQEMLSLNGVFIPNGAFLAENGNTKVLGLELNYKKLPSNGELIDRFHALAQNENIQVYSLAFEVSIQIDKKSPPTDAICVEIYGADSPTFYQPFKLTDEELFFDDIFAVK